MKIKISVGFPSLLTLLFIGLKLTGVITWSWFWVLSPLWITAIFSVLVIIGYVMISMLIDVIREIK